VKSTKLTSTTDYLATLGDLERTIVSKFAKPVTYNFMCAYDLELNLDGQTESLKGKAVYNYQQNNK